MTYQRVYSTRWNNLLWGSEGNVTTSSMVLSTKCGLETTETGRVRWMMLDAGILSEGLAVEVPCTYGEYWKQANVGFVSIRDPVSSNQPKKSPFV